MDEKERLIKLNREVILVSTLSGMNQDNVKEIFERNYQRWLKAISGEVYGKSKGGLELTRAVYIKKILPKLEQITPESVGSTLKLDREILLELYIDYLKYLKNEALQPQQTVCGLDGIYTDETLEAIFDRLKDLGWFKGEKSHFVAIFKPEPLPVGWEAIEYTKKKTITPHQSALAALVKLIVGDKVGTGYVWSGFTVNKKTFEIDKNRDSYKELETTDLKGIELKRK